MIRDPISVFDTSVSTRNVGDEIIMESVLKELRLIFKDRQIFRIPTHNSLSLDSYKCLHESEFSIVGGTNLLSSNMPFYRQWKVSPIDVAFVREAVLLGVGWWQYQKKPNWYTKNLLRGLLSANRVHSVRDGYTELVMRQMGFKNVINTGCPTMWELNPEFCKNIPADKAGRVIYTLTDYNKDPKFDVETVKVLRGMYEEVSIWIQGSKDLVYLNELGLKDEFDRVIPPQLSAFDQALEAGEVEYVGTRLHAGIRALQKKRRSLILAVDNRAIEKEKDYRIHVVKRGDMDSLRKMIVDSRDTVVNLNMGKVDEWRHQAF